jgi:hypothetical protein
MRMAISLERLFGKRFPVSSRFGGATVLALVEISC